MEDVNTSARNARREIQARLDSDRARKLGLAPQDMADAFAFTLGGLRLPRFNAGDREVEVNLSLTLEDRENLADLRQLVVRSAEGRPVQLGDVASFEVVPRAQTLERENRKIRVVVRASFDGKSFGPTREEISETMNALGLPPGITWSFNDRIQEQSEQGKTMALNFLLALVLVYVLMASLFESVSQPFAILFSIPFSLVGASWFLALTGTPFNLMANMGVLILMGIVVNNGIVLLDRVPPSRPCLASSLWPWARAGWAAGPTTTPSPGRSWAASSAPPSSPWWSSPTSTTGSRTPPPGPAEGGRAARPVRPRSPPAER